ncbi:hypothetical protein [Halalkalibacter alkaliphilus]|uniref:Flagellar hook-length control protein-like C-terminal domain-containing protein n=1 Tax=Halalkalibacter alkaliphilus TaxID=2917993 RepID=A0A9X1ZVT0_9BACI|nr:hypothetical protein [Halalkalibacter alkaliphilus]MCL7746449.1 hypothetical protein [Halalkalibacter alkaliphilus]
MFQPSIQHQPLSKMQQQPKVLILKTGQLFQGRITKVFPNHLATLTIGKMQLTARLEAPLTVGQRYWFEVKDGTGLPQLRVLADTQTSSNDQVLQRLGLPQKKEMESLLQYMTKKQILFTREMISEGVTILSQVNQLNKQGIETITTMLERGIPLSRETFLAIDSKKQLQPLSELIFQLSGKLKEVENETARKITELCTKLLRSSPIQTTTSPITQLLTMYAKEDNPHIENLLIRLGLIKEGLSRDEVMRKFQQAVVNPTNQHVVDSLWPKMDRSQNTNIAERLLFNRYIGNLIIPAGKEGMPKLKQLLTLLQTPIQVQDLYLRWSLLPNQSLSKSEERIISTLMENSVSISQNPGAILKALLSMIGYEYEHDVMRYFQGESTKEYLNTSRLKALLLQLQEQTIPQSIKNQGMELLARITSNQLFAHEQAGPLHQILLYIPLSLGDRKTDLTIKWEGKKVENGQLDPSFCRVLFYLTLERLEETMVDVQVQNRIVTIAIYNEQDKPVSLLKLLEPSLKRRLSDLHYQLSTVVWKKIEDIDVGPSSPTYSQVPTYKGVDVRI